MLYNSFYCIIVVFASFTHSLPTVHLEEQPTIVSRTTDEIATGNLAASSLTVIENLEGLDNPSAVITDAPTTALSSAAYTTYAGDGSAAARWPTIDKWKTYDEL